MNEKNSQRISHARAHVSLLVENVTQDENGIMVRASVSVRNQ